MKYMLLCYSDEKSYAEGEREECMAESAALTHQLHREGKYLLASPLHPVATATSVRVRQGKRLVTDGPFAETREQLGGFYVLECKDIDEAAEWAAKAPGAQFGSVEVRPLWDKDLMAAVEAARERGYLRK